MSCLSWTNREVVEWFKLILEGENGLDFGRLEESRIDGEDLYHLTENDLRKDLKITNLHVRKCVWKSIKKLTQQRAQGEFQIINLRFKGKTIKMVLTYNMTCTHLLKEAIEVFSLKHLEFGNIFLFTDYGEIVPKSAILSDLHFKNLSTFNIFYRKSTEKNKIPLDWASLEKDENPYLVNSFEDYKTFCQPLDYSFNEIKKLNSSFKTISADNVNKSISIPNAFTSSKISLSTPISLEKRENSFSFKSHSSSSVSLIFEMRQSRKKKKECSNRMLLISNKKRNKDFLTGKSKSKDKENSNSIKTSKSKNLLIIFRIFYFHFSRTRKQM